MLKPVLRVWVMNFGCFQLAQLHVRLIISLTRKGWEDPTAALGQSYSSHIAALTWADFRKGDPSAPCCRGVWTRCPINSTSRAGWSTAREFLSAFGHHALLVNKLTWVLSTILLKLEVHFVEISPKLELLIKQNQQPVNAPVVPTCSLVPRDIVWRIQSRAVAEGLNSRNNHSSTV